MSLKKCCVPNCNKTRENNTILHLFPNPDKNLDRFQKWINAIGGEISMLDNKSVFERRSVCHSHFEPQFYTRSKRLSPSAVPTLFLQSIQSPHFEEINIIEHISPAHASTISQQPFETCLIKLEPSTSKGNVQRNYFKKCPTEVIALGNKIIELQQAKYSALTTLKKALKLSENITFQRALKNFTAAAALCTTLQYREVGKKNTGRRFNKDEILMALALYKQGPRAYRWLRFFFVLPSPLKLSRIISRATLKPVVNKHLLVQLKKKMHKITYMDRLCVLLLTKFQSNHIKTTRESLSL